MVRLTEDKEYCTNNFTGGDCVIVSRAFNKLREYENLEELVENETGLTLDQFVNRGLDDVK